MSASGEVTIPATWRARRSIGADFNANRAMEKENATVDVGATLAASRKKSRSKSIGPGGLDALKQGSGNRRASLAVPSKPPRSILKPTIAPLPEIPSMTNKQNHSLADKAGKRGSNSTSSLTSDELGGSKIALRTEEEQQAAAREREERDRRDARRKSLANRRVSFAAEATLHTFHEVEFKQQPATSTDAQRRPAAAISSRDTAPQEDIQPNSEQLDDQNAPFQPKRRRSSVAAPQVRMPSTEDDNLTSTIYSSDSEPADAVEEIAADEEEEEEDSNSDSDDGTMMSMETVEVTGTTNASERSVDSDEESSTIDAVLRMASQRAGAQRGGNDMEEDSDDGEEVIPSFGWAKKGNQQSSSSIEREAVAVVAPQSRSIPGDEGTEMDMDMDADMDMDMDMTRAMGRIIQPSVALGVDEEQEMSMDVTRAFGGILSENRMSNNTADLRSDQPDEEPMDGATMEFTTAIGGIHRSQPEYSDELEEENEDMSMELTTILGGVLSKKRNEGLEAARQRTLNRISDIDLDETKMDMTVGLGRIISVPSPDNNTTVDDELTLGMDMTMAIGGIINNGTNTGRMLGKRILEEEVDKPHTPKEAVITAVSQASPQRYSSPQRRVASATETTPDILTLRGKGLRRSVGSQVSVVNEDVVPKPKIPSPTKPSTPRQGLASPGRQVQSSRNRTPRSSSPKKAHAAPPNRTPSPVKPVQSRNRTSFFRTNPTTGERTPTAVLTPQRKLSGIGADRNGLGSPQVAALFERRGSIGDSASIFVPGKRVVAFNDPQGMVAEIDRERQEEAAKENISTVIEKDMNGSQEDKDATLNLREMIERLSPKRKQFRSRKSLHVGSAKGLLGKRPSELDDEDNAEDNDGIKRLKGHQGSPVKNIRLQQPPSKAETTGRATRASRRSLEGSRANLASSFSSPLKGTQALTPQNNKNFKDHTNQTIHNVNFHELASNADAETANDVDEERVHLQDFLNMTSIRFMELTTTKRRHTIAPGTHLDGSGADGEDDLSLEPCVVAGACTVPMLELYQHSCRELKKYISEGRRIIKEIETDTFEENPPLFQEYMSATPEVKALMDNQFKNVKTHARLLSKAMWYEWRMKLQDGLKEGLINISEGMKSDDLVLQEQQTLLASILPDIRKRYEALVEENSNLEEAAQELADCDPAELQAARDGLISLDHDIAEKKKLIASLRQQFETSEADVKVLAAQKVQCLADIEEAEATREECRGWTSTEVNALKARVNAIEKKHGWAVTGLSGSTLSMAYKREIELVFDITSFQTHKSNSQIDLWYIADSRESNPLPKTAVKEFWLQCIRDHVRALPQSQTRIADLLQAVREAWDKANTVSSHISRLNVTFPTSVIKTSDSSIAVTASLLLVPLETRVEASLHLQGRSGPNGVEVSLSTEAKVLYGEQFNVGKVGEFLATRIGDTVGATEEQWCDVMVELHGRLIARGRKQ